jgi:hypothetical protein
VLYLHPDGQLRLTDLAAQQDEALPLALAAPQPGDEANAWLQFRLYTPPQVSPAGQRMMLPDGSGGWLMYDWTTRSVLQTFTASDAIRSPTWAPDGRRLAFIQDGRLCLLTLDAGTTECLPAFSDAALFALWSPRGEHIAVIAGECCQAEVFLLDAESGHSQPAGVTDLTFETNVRHLLAWTYDQESGQETLAILSQGEADRAELFSPQEASSRQLDDPLAGISADGETILTLSAAVGTSGGDIFHRLSEQPSTLLLKDWAWSPGGDRLAILHVRRDLADSAAALSVISLADRKLLWEKSFDLPLARVEWSRDASVLLLDQADLRPGDSPIWRLSADGQGEPEMLIEAGFLLAVLP